MNDNELDRLIQDELEGLATPEAAERLRAILARDPRARARHGEMASVFRALREAKRESAPAEIREGVLAAIAAGHEAGASRLGRPAAVTSTRRRPTGLGWAVPFLAGAVVGGLVIALGYPHLGAGPGALGPSGRTGLPVTGTLPPPEAPVAPRQIARAVLPVEARPVGGALQLRFAAPPGARVMTIEFDAGTLAPLELRWGRPGRGRAAIEPGRVRLELTEGDLGVLVLAPLRAGEATIRVTTQGDAGTAQGTLHTTLPPRKE